MAGQNQLFLAPFQPELEEAFLDFIKEKKERDPLIPLVVLVGSNLLRLYLRRLFVQKGLNHINLRFLTFLDLARALSEESLSKQMLRPLPRFGDLVAIISLIEKLGENSYFQPIADRRGFQRGLAATFQDLWEGGIEELPVRGEKKLIELGDLYKAYRSMTGKEFYNDSERLFRAAKEIHNFSRIFGCQELIIYGFYDFTEAQGRLVKACMDQLSVTAFMPWRPSAGFAYASWTLRWYKELGFRGILLERPNKEKKNSLPLLQQDLFLEKLRGFKAPHDGAVKLISAPNEMQEVREIVREIFRLAKEENIDFHEMAILLRNPDLYGPLILETFQAFKIPVYFQGGVPLWQTQVGKSSLLMLDLIGSNLKRSEVMEFLTFAPIAWSRFFPEEPSPAQWDLISREAGIVEGRKQWEDKLSSWVTQWQEKESLENPQRKDSLGQAAEDFRMFLKKFFADLDRFPAKGTWKKMSGASILFLQGYLAEGETREAISQTLRELEALDALGREIDVWQFKEIFGEALKEKTIPRGAFQKGGILVSDLMPARGSSFRAVFIPGLVERAFPGPMRQDPLLLDHERQEVNGALGEKGKLPLKRFRLPEEQLLFSLAAGSAREKLILSYPRLDSSSGRERLPSFFLLRVGEALQGESVDYSQLETLPAYQRVPLSRLAPEDLTSAIDEEEYDLGQVRKALRKNDKGEISYLKFLFPTFSRAERLARLRWGFRVFTEYDGCLKSDRALKQLREGFTLSGKTLSPTKLETYASCPFRYFLSEVLELRPLPSPEEIRQIQPLDRGSVIHAVLHQFYRQVLKKNPGPLRPDNMEVYWQIMLEVSSRVFAEAEGQGLTGLPLLWELDRQTILEDLRAFLKNETLEEKMMPADFEIRFGYEKTTSQQDPLDKPPSLTLDDGTVVSFRGRIDRVDLSPEEKYLRVIDYKTGKVQGEEDGFCGGTTLQLPIYLMAAWQIWSQANREKSWAEYYTISREKKFKRLLFRGEKWAEKEKALKKIVHTITRGIAEGTFFAYSGDGRNCGYCDFSRLCEQGADVLFERKKNDPRAATFLEMRRIP